MTAPHPDVAAKLRDALHVGVGLGLLAFQKAQVHREDLQKALRDTFGDTGDTVRDYVKVVEERISAR